MNELEKLANKEPKPSEKFVPLFVIVCLIIQIVLTALTAFSLHRTEKELEHKQQPIEQRKPLNDQEKQDRSPFSA